MDVSNIELIYNPNQDHHLYTPVILTASILANHNQQLITIKSTENKIQNVNAGVDLLVNSKPLNQQLNAFSICQLLIQLVNKPSNLYPSDDILQINLLVDLIENNVNNLISLATNFDNQLLNRKYLINSNLTLADLFLWSQLAYSDNQFDKLDRLKNWYKRIENDLKGVLSLLSFYKPRNISSASKSTKLKEKDSKAVTSTGRKVEGKYVDLPGAEKGKVVVRFPPEASGYLHIGHAKAALLNQYYQLAFDGKLIFRFDDTNPEKEKEDFEEVIREDVSLLQIKPDICSYTSDHFDLILEKCEYLLKQSKAYVDDTPAEQMKSEREQRIESKNRNNSVEKNMQMWEQMKLGTVLGQQCCVRAKIDMKSDNGCLRDPTMYRCKNTPHPRTGTKFKVYPTYDFACPIVDSVEGVTHSLRTTEYMDRDPQFFWFIDALGLRKVNIYAYSRLNLMHTVLSKRRLTWFVDNKIVSGWDDPRMPTVRGILRRGLTVDGLKEFIIAQGSSRSIVMMDWDKLWVFNRKIIDPKAVRYMGVEKNNSVKVNLENVDTISEIEVDCHPKNPELKKRKMKVSKQLLIDQSDAALIKENDSVTFMNLGNVLISKVVKDASGIVQELYGRFDPSNKDFKKTLKVSWIDSTNLISAKCCYYENLIEKPILDKENDEFKDFVNKESEIIVDFLVEKSLTSLKKGDIIQVIRKGFFICDQPYDKNALSHTSLDSWIVLFSIADGTTDLTNYPKVVQDAKIRLREKIASFTSSSKKQPAKQQSNEGDDSEDPNSITIKIQELGSRVRDMKANKSPKDQFMPLVTEMNKLKDKYKQLTGQEYQPTQAPSNQSKSQQQQPQQQPSKKEKQPVNKQSNEGDDLEDPNLIMSKIQELGSRVRDMKANKSPKDQFMPLVTEMNKLKDKYKQLTGQEYQPTQAPSNQSKSQQQQPQQQPSKKEKQPVNKQSNEGDDLEDPNLIMSKIQELGSRVRDMKANKSPKDQFMPLVTEMNKLKDKYKQLTGQEYQPTQAPSNQSKSQQQQPQQQPSKKEKQPVNKQSNEGDDLEDPNLIMSKIQELGSRVRDMKANKSPKDQFMPLVTEMNKLKDKYKQLTGQEYQPTQASSNQSKSQQQQQQPSKKEKQAVNQQALQQQSNDGDKKKKQTKLGIETKKSENFSEWYTEVITKSEMIDYYDISGCYVLWEWSFGIWEKITEYLDNKIKQEGVKNVGFPLFVSKRSLEVEENHIADFAPEVAWVTKSGTSDMQEPIAIRPTSETVMYPYFAKRIKSHRDLPVKVNQWCNVVRWEFKDPTPFLRTREFYWQEGHTAHATKEDAIKEVHVILDHYASVYEYLLAIPVIKGKKTEKEKFPGGDITTTIEGFISENGRGIQAGTSHFLGQNFSKMFEIVFSNLEGKKEYAFQNSWGFTTRSIGVMVMEHSDDKGLVLPPRVAPIQVIIIPCGLTTKTSDSDKEKLLNAAKQLENELKSVDILAELDASEHNTVGWKYSHWELKGVPLRIELGPKDLDKNEFVAIRRDTFTKQSMKLSTAKESIKSLLEVIQNNLFETAKNKRDSKLKIVDTMDQFNQNLNNKCLILAPFCGEDNCEEAIKKSTTSTDQSGSTIMGAKSLCIPFEQPTKPLPDKCIFTDCKLKPQYFTLFGRSY